MEPTICHISTFAPTQCGIAAYVGDLIAGLPGWHSLPLRMVFPVDRRPVDPLASDLTLTVAAASNREYIAMAEVINCSSCQLVSLQHEFGIFGGDDGEYVVDLVAGIRKPLVTTFHTVSPALSWPKVRILKSLARYSSRIVVLSDEDASVLASLVDCSTNKIAVIKYGVPETQFEYPTNSEVRRRMNAGVLFVSAGYVRQTKGYHLALPALALFKQRCRDFKYLILGKVQPQYGNGIAYREEIGVLVARLGLSEHVVWIEEHLPLSQLIEYITAADVGLATYTEEGQASSGVVPLMLALGRPVVATAFAYAVRMARQTPGLHIAKSDDPQDLCEVILDTVRDAETLRLEMVSAYSAMRPHIWSHVAEEYERVFHAVLGTEPRVALGPQQGAARDY